MKQAVKDLKNIYGQEINDSDSEGIEELSKQSKIYKPVDKNSQEARFKAFVPQKVAENVNKSSTAAKAA